MPFDPEPVEASASISSAVERRAATLPGRRTVKKEWQAAWLVKALQCIDLTTLSGDDTEGRVERLCAKARKPLRERPPGGARPRRPAHHGRRGLRLSPLRRDGEGGAGRQRHSGRRRLDRLSRRPRAASRRDRARSRRRSPTAPTRSTSSSPASMCSRGDWQALYDEVRAFKAACGAGAYEDDPRHRRPEDAPQRRHAPRGGDDGRRPTSSRPRPARKASTPRCPWRSS